MAQARAKKLASVGLAERLRQTRERAGLSQLELSRQAGLGKMTASDIEAGRRNQINVGIGTVERLANALGVTASFLAYGEESTHALHIKDWMAPGFDPLKMVRELATTVNGSGGHIEQSYKYLDAMDADNWCAFIQQPQYASFIECVPIKLAAEGVRKQCGGAALDIIGLGVGTGRHEARLVGDLLEHGQQDLRLFLLDISQPLLSIASRQASQVLADHPAVPLCAIHGNFHQLPSYAHLFSSQRRRRRLLSMFGYTFGNLDNEIRFLRNSLTITEPGDLLLFDAQLAHAPAEDHAAVMKHDPALAQKRTGDFQRRQEEFNIGPIRRYTVGLQDIEFSRHLDTRSCVVPGSYAIDMRATVKLKTDESKHFSVAYVKRYDADKLASLLAQEGWTLIQSWKYGEDFHMLCLLQRQH